jgi:DNA-binding transcriptional LysR family regulator
MDVRFLQSFVTVVDSGSMAEAARRLDLTPAAIATRIKTLEDGLGTPLVCRVGRTVKATEAGLKILEHARRVLRDVRDLHAIANDDAPLGELRLGASTSALTGLLPPVLCRLYERLPKLELYIEPGTSSHLYHRVTTGVLDAAVIVEPQFALPKACTWQALVEEPLCVLAPSSMAGRDPLEVLATEPFLRYDRAMWGGRLADRYLRERQIRPHERIELDALNAIAVLVHQGLGVSLLPDWTPPWPEGLQIVRLALPSPVPVRRMGLLWTTRGPHAGLAHTLAQEAQAVWGTALARAAADSRAGAVSLTAEPIKPAQDHSDIEDQRPALAA